MKYLKNKTLLLLLSFVLLAPAVFGQNLLKERIRKIPSRKKSVYLDTGIFHNGAEKRSSKLKAVRHNYSKKKGYERVVLDFTTDKMPRVYGFISREGRKLYLDLFDTEVPAGLKSFGDSQYVEELLFFPIQNDTLSVEVVFKTKINLDVFYLNNPARLVIDIKK